MGVIKSIIFLEKQTLERLSFFETPFPNSGFIISK